MIRNETHFARQARATLSESPLLQRIRMAKVRARSYPVDSMDFILADLERPETLRRHADFCTGDLTGRYLDFLTASMPFDPSDAERLDGLFHRILKCQAPNGAFGRPYSQDMGVSESELLWGTSYRLFTGLLRYHALTGDVKALTAAIRNAEYFFERIDRAKAHIADFKAKGTFDIFFWIAEPMALLYAFTGDERCVDLCRTIADALPASIERQHAHGLMTALRGLQFAAIFTGDRSFAETVDRYIELIDREYVWPDGNVPEVFWKRWHRNEGCAIADWVMLNLYSGFISGDPKCYARAENALYNAMFLNQIVSGGFGTREFTAGNDGYSKGELSEECWWCCLHTCGLAMTEFADHAVTLRGEEIHINCLLSGKYTLHHEGREIVVEVATRYPEAADTFVYVTGAGEGIDIHLNVPKWIRGAQVADEQLPGGTRRIRLTGRMGYELSEARGGGVFLRYGPLVLVPLHYDSTSRDYIDYAETGIPKDYVPASMPQGRPAIVPDKADADGFLVYPKEPHPLWQSYTEGRIERIAYEDLSVNVPLYFADGKIRFQRFLPECNSTTTIIGSDLPITFEKG